MDDPDLGALIDMQIRVNGPMPLSTYMGLCLGHPRRGYYSKGDPFGAAGDFVTAPEISQMFGELIGLWCVHIWQQLKEPKAFTLLELGPGRGTLMADLLRAGSRAPGFIDALHLQLFELNPDLRAKQQERLAAFNPYWAQDIDAVGDGPLIVVANEFFDALPIRQFVKRADGWHERQVGLRDGKRAFGLSPLALPNDAIGIEAGDGEVLEDGAAANTAIARLAAVVTRQDGAILAIDYGYGRTQAGETLQAIRNHAFADPLDDPGMTDLSSHVNFAALASSARPLQTKLTTQRQFLAKLGIADRAASLARANPGEIKNIEVALTRLTATDQMGELFKVFCAHGPGIEPAGFS